MLGNPPVYASSWKRKTRKFKKKKSRRSVKQSFKVKTIFFPQARTSRSHLEWKKISLNHLLIRQTPCFNRDTFASEPVVDYRVINVLCLHTAFIWSKQAVQSFLLPTSECWPILNISNKCKVQSCLAYTNSNTCELFRAYSMKNGIPIQFYFHSGWIC